MADPDRINEKTLINQGEGQFLQDVKMMLDPYEESHHPLAMLQQDKESNEALSQMTADEFKKWREGVLRTAVAKGEARLIRRISEMQDKVLVTAVKILSESLANLQGDATQRVEVVKRGLTPDQMDQIIKKLPKSIESEDITSGGKGKGRRSKRLDGNVLDTRQNEKGD